MNEDSSDVAERCGRFVRFALQPRLIPADNVEYLELVDEFLSDSRFQDVAKAFALGLGLRVLSVSTQSGLILGTTIDSPFQLRREDYHSRMSSADRIVQGFVHLGIAAWCFPRAEDLREDEDVLPARLTVENLVEYLHSLCEEFKNREESGTPASHPKVRAAWQYVLALGKFADSTDGRGSFATLSGKIRHALNFLTEHGFLKREGGETRPTWLARPAFRIHVREFSGQEAFGLVARVAQEAVNG